MKLRQIHAVCTVVFVLMSMCMYAQNPSCPSNLLYFASNGNIMVFDPSLPLSSTNPSSITIVPPFGAGALALLPNISGGTLTPTFYTTINGTYHYWTGSTWFNTGHSTGNSAAVNMGGCANTIYNMGGFNPPIIYTYNGTANGTSLCAVPNGCVADVVGDCDCNFYIFNPLMPNQALIRYGPTGIVQATFALIGIPSASGGGGFALIGDKVYYSAGNQLYTGTLGASAVNFTSVTMSSANPVGGTDWAMCPSGLPVSIAASSGSICSGGSVTLTASGANTYSWLPSGTGSIVVASPVLGNNIFTVTGTGASLNCSAQAQISVVGLPSPTVNVSISQPTVCSGQIVQLSALGASSYSWLPQGSGQSFSITATTSGIFTVTGMASTGSCTSQNTVQLQVNPSPAVSVSGKTLVCKGDAVTFTASGANTYSWNGVPGTATYSFIAAANGSLVLQGKNPQTTCEGSTTFTYSVKICTGLSQEFADQGLTIYPNPAKEKITFYGIENFTCRIFDLQGTELDKLIIDANGDADISHLPPGVYFMRLDRPFYIHAKLVKE